MPRLAIVFEFPTLSGGERSMLAVLGENSPPGWDVVALAPSDGPLAEALHDHGVPHESFDVREEGVKPPPEWAAKALWRAVEHVSADLVHANSLSMGRVTGRLSRTSGVTATAHVRDIMKLSRAAVNDLNTNEAVICVSDATRQAHVDQGLDPVIARVVYNGVVREELTRPAGWLRAELGVSDSTPLIGTVGQICLRKGHDVAARALSRLADLDWRWVVVGERFSQKPESITFDESIEATLANVGLQDRVVRLGYRHDMADVYGELDVLLHTARQEPFGRVLLEAGAVGVPVVATEAGGTRELVGSSIPLAPVDDDATLAEHLRSALTNPTRHGYDVNQFTIARALEQTWSIWMSALQHG